MIQATNQPYKLGLSLIFVDQSKDQINNIREFLNGRGVRTGNVLRASKGTAYMIAVSRFAAVRETLRQMLPHLYKKANEVQAALDYYEGKITGNALMAIFQNEVEAGRRERRPRKVPIHVILRSEEHTSELQSRSDLVCRLLLEKKKKTGDVEDETQHDV